MAGDGTAAKRSHDEQASAGAGQKEEAQEQQAAAAEPTAEEGAANGSSKGDQNGKAAEEEPEQKRQATEGKKAELSAEAPLADTKEIPKDVIEEGRIYFVYRPRVSEDHPTSVDDIQRFFIIQAPTSRKAPARLLAVGKKQLPSAAGHERFFGFVSSTAAKVDDIMAGLGPNKYETKTRGTRETPAARIAGEGVYALTGKDERQTKLVYKLELPEDLGQVQKDLNISAAGTMTLSIKNPDISSPANAGLDDKADFVKDDEKMKQFGNYRWIGAHDPSLLDYERCEFLLIGSSDKLEGSVAAETKEHLEQVAADDIAKALHAAGKDDAPDKEEAEEAALLDKLRKELHPEKADVPVDAAATGEWK